MNTKKMQMYLLLIVFLAAIAVYVGLKSYNERFVQEAEEISVLALEEEMLSAFSYDYEGVVYNFERSGEEEWICTNEPDLAMDQTAVAGLYAGVLNITSELAIEDVKDMEEYGLKSPGRTIVLTNQNQTYTLLVGDYNEMINKYYFCLEGGDTVYTISGYRTENFNHTPQELMQEEDSVSESDQ